jgi:hypothetical protein
MHMNAGDQASKAAIGFLGSALLSSNGLSNPEHRLESHKDSVLSLVGQQALLNSSIQAASKNLCSSDDNTARSFSYLRAEIGCQDLDILHKHTPRRKLFFGNTGFILDFRAEEEAYVAVAGIHRLPSCFCWPEAGRDVGPAMSTLCCAHQVAGER